MLHALANVGLKPRFRAGEPVTEQGNTVTDKKVVVRLSLSSLGASASAGTGEPEIMAGRYQGYHIFRDEDGESRRSVEVFWEHNGWFWRPRFKGRLADGEAVGPFTTSTQAYESAKRSAAPPTTPQT